MVIRYTRLTGDGRYANVIATTFTAAQSQHAKFVNTYYDDNAWWALAWIAAFDLTRESRYLEAARTIFARNTAAWDHSCGGGLRWHAKSTYKNAITNELFVTLAALLHQRSPGGGYLTWAQRGWEWFSARGFIGPAGLVNDGITLACQNNGATTWTYNQGVILGGLAALSEITGDRGYLTQGEAIAAAALRGLAPRRHPGRTLRVRRRLQRGPGPVQGHLRPLPVRLLAAQSPARLPRLHPGQRQFGVGPRPERPPAIRPVPVRPNAVPPVPVRPAAVPAEFGLHWAGPFDQATPARQTSALDALIAAAALAP